MTIDWFAVLPLWAAICLLLLEYGIKIIAIGVVPENRRPSSAQTWLLLILFVPLVGLIMYWLIGSQYLVGRRHRIQAEANTAILAATQGLDFVSADVYRSLSPGARGVVRLTRSLTAMPLVMGRCTGIYPDYQASIDAMTAAVRSARQFVHLETFILSHDEQTADFFAALAEAAERGVKVRVLFDHMGSWRYPGYRAMLRALNDGGVQWRAMLPIQPYRLRWRRPDLRNHRKLLVVDNEVGLLGSQNLIDSGYLKRKHRRANRHWKDLNIRLAGPLVADLNVVFCLDWFTETGEGLFDMPQLSSELGAEEAEHRALGLPELTRLLDERGETRAGAGALVAAPEPESVPSEPGRPTTASSEPSARSAASGHAPGWDRPGEVTDQPPRTDTPPAEGVVLDAPRTSGTPRPSSALVSPAASPGAAPTPGDTPTPASQEPEAPDPGRRASAGPVQAAVPDQRGRTTTSDLIASATETALDEPFQLLPSGPGFATEPNLRVFNALIYLARRSITLVSPYFVPDESLLMALTSAAQRGVRVDLVVSERGDQFWADHAQRSYYEALLVAGVRLWLYPAPTVLHAKHFTIDDSIAVVGSSNLDMRSFWLDYEVSLVGYGRRFTEVITTAQRDYLSVCRQLTLAEWLARPMLSRWVDNVARLTSALQ